MKGLSLALTAALPAAAQTTAPEVGTGEFRYSSELLAQGFASFAASGVGNTVYGLHSGADVYLCFLADRPALQADRQQAILRGLTDAAAPRTVPNIPVVCVATE